MAHHSGRRPEYENQEVYRLSKFVTKFATADRKTRNEFLPFGGICPKVSTQLMAGCEYRSFRGVG